MTFKCTLAVALLVVAVAADAPASAPSKFPLYAIDQHDYMYYEHLAYDAYTCIRMGYDFVFPNNANYYTHVSAAADAATTDMEWYGWQWAYSTDPNFCGSHDYMFENGDGDDEDAVRYNDRWCQSRCVNKGNMHVFREDGSGDPIDWRDSVYDDSSDLDTFPVQWTSSEVPQDWRLTVTWQSSWNGEGDRTNLLSKNLNWCDQQVTEFMDVTDEPVQLRTGYSMWSSATKCSYFIKTALEGAPAFKIESMTVDPASSNKLYNFDLHYIEYAHTEIDYLPRDIFQVTDLTGSGNSTNTQIAFETYPNPWGVQNSLEPSDKLNYHSADYIPGQKNRFMTYYIEDFGPDGTYLEKSFEATQHDYDAWTHVNEEYEALRSSYNAQRRDYNEKMQIDRTLVADPLAAFDETLVNTVPARPCRPDRPSKYLGTWLDPNIKTLGGLNRSLQKRPDVAYWPRSSTSKSAGILTSVPDAAAPTFLESGHVFGNLGQGEDTMPADIAWSPAEDNTRMHHEMIVSIFPNDSTFVGGENENQIEMQVSMVGWGGYGSNLGPKPEQLSVAEHPNAVYNNPYITSGLMADSAKYLAGASMAALVASMI